MRIDVQQLKNAARGRWLSIFQQLGIEVPENGNHGPCPIENDGKDRFRCDNRNGEGSWFCNNCGAGDGISLVRQCLGLSFPDTMTKISEIIGMGCGIDSQVEKGKYDPREMLNKVWKSSQKLTNDDPVTKYLNSRKLFKAPDNVRYCPECYESDTKSKMPAMVAMFMNREGKPISLHRTYLNGIKKADIKSPKKLMKGTEPLSGGAIRLFNPTNKTIGIAEGIETAIAATIVTDIPTWSAVSSTLLKAFDPPEGITKIVIFGDSDPNFCGQQAAYSLANRLYSKDFLVTVEFPEIGKDWNDFLIGPNP